MKITTYALSIDHLTQEDGATIPQLRHEVTELVPGVSHRDWLCGLGHIPPPEHFEHFEPGKPVRIQAKIERQLSIHTN